MDEQGKSSFCIDEGYVRPAQISHGIRLQKILAISALVAMLSMSVSSISSASSVMIQWDPNTESDLAGYKVYYAAGLASFDGVTPVDVQNQTTATISGLDPSQTYDFAVTAYNTSGIESSFSNIVSVAEISPPIVDMTSPIDGSNVSGAVSVSVNATDNVGVTKVEFYVNGVLKSSASTSPYIYSWDTLSLPSGSYTLMAKAYDAAGNVTQSSSTVTLVNDIIPPIVAVTAPANNAIVSGSVGINAGASDNVGVSMVEIYANGVLLFASNSAPYSYTWDTKSVANGSYTLYARASDNNGNVNNSLTVTVTVNNIVPDVTVPTLGTFSMPATSTSLTVPVSGLSATDNKGVTGYLITENATAPAATAAGWSSTAPASFTFSGEGAKTAYAWAKDAAGNISAARSATVTITLPDVIAPVLSGFSMPVISKSLTVAVTSFAATDNVGVTGYLITESSTKPSAAAYGWRTTKPTSFRFSRSGTRTAYAWVKDAAGNVSASKSATVLIDTTLPTITAFTVPTISNSLTVAVLSFTSSDNTGVIGYLITQSSTKPSATASNWSATAPASFTFSGTGSRTVYAWVKDKAGNVSAYKSATVTIR